MGSEGKTNRDMVLVKGTGPKERPPKPWDVRKPPGGRVSGWSKPPEGAPEPPEKS